MRPVTIPGYGRVSEGRPTSKKKKKKIGRKKEGEMANSKTELPKNLNGEDPTVYFGPAFSPRRVARANALV
jgi:hypothetical protein